MITQMPPPLPIDRSTTWWQRNWKWFIPTCLGGTALFTGFIVLIVTIVFGMMKSSPAYKEALSMARADLSVKEALGSPIKEGFLVMGNINVNGSSGHADLAIPVSGPEGSGTIYVVASKSAAGQWTILRLVVDVKATNQRIDLLSAASALRVHRALVGRPVTASNWLVIKTGITPATVNKSLEHLVRLGIVQELTSRRRNRVFSYEGYLEIMNQGTELPD